MSPEQARGLAVDTRTDVWAFGCVLYEMLAGRKTFHGDTVADCLAAIVGREPDWTMLPSSVPESVVALIKHCLQKEVQSRLADIGHAHRGLEDVLATVTGRVIRAGVERPVRRRIPVLVFAAATAGSLLAGAFGVGAIRQLMLEPERVDIGLPNDEFIPSTHSSELALSNDGTLIAYGSSKRMTVMPKMDSNGTGGASDQTDDSIGSTPSMSMVEQIYVRAPAEGR